MIRKLCVILSCGVAFSLLLCNQAPMPAQTKKDDLNKQIADLKKKVSDRDQTITTLKATATTNTQSMKDKDSQIKTLTDQTTAQSKRLKDFDNLKKAGYIHALILKLKTADDAQVKKVYDQAFKTIAKIDGVRALWIAKPAEDDISDGAQKDYQLGLIVMLDDSDALKAYLDDPLYKKFTDKMAGYWEKPIVYDMKRDLDAEKKNDPKNKQIASDKDSQ